MSNMPRPTPLLILIVVVASCNCYENVTKTSLQIGGFFSNREEMYAFNDELRKRSNHRVSFEPNFLTSKAADSYTTLKEVCARTQKDSWAALVDGTQTTGTCGALCQLLHKVHIPQLVISWRPAEESAESKKSFGLAYYPQPSTLSTAYATYIKMEGWNKIVLLYEDSGGLIRLQRIMTSHPFNEPLIIRRLDPEGDNMAIFKEITHHDHVVVDCVPGNVIKYLREIIEVKSKVDFHRYLFTSLDTHTIDLRPVSEHEFNITTMHMIQGTWNYSEVQNSIMLQTGLAMDAATHVSSTLESMLATETSLPKIPSICQKSIYNTDANSYETWGFGERLIESMAQKSFDGRTGRVQFESGFRTNFTLFISTASKQGFVAHSYWNSATDEIINMKGTMSQEPLGPTTTKKIRVVGRGSKPYFGYNNDTKAYEGFSVDLITEIFKYINEQKPNGKTYEFEFYKAENDTYDSMQKDLVERKADLGICDLTMTSERQKKVDFSAPFMSLGITILAKKQDPPDPNMFSFLDPLALDLWLCLGTAYMFVSFVLLICARMSQEDWVNPHPCDRNPEALENIWTISNCYWLSMGTIMTQGCDILPRAVGSRWVTGMWWFFALIITASYTANMSTFLSNSRRDNQVTNVKGLASQNKIKYGTIKNQATYKFFQNSNDSVYKKIFTVMESERPTVYVKTPEEGLERVLKGKNKYVFFMESTSAEYYVERHNCSLEVIGGRLDSKEYGIAMPRGSSIRLHVDAALLQLQEKRTIAALKELWWEQKDGSENCTKNAENKAKESTGNEDSLQMENTSGIFVVLLAGAALGLMYALIDFVMHARKISIMEQVTWKEALLSEWKSSLNPRLLSKPVAPPRSAAPSENSSQSEREKRSTSRAVSVLRAAQSFINLDKVY